LKRFSTKPATKLFDKILIANRGEIARRIIRTCHLLNIETVALYTSQGDSIKSPHVQEATHSFCLGSDPKSFLDIDRISEAIVTSGADAVHPGYGFLSENAEFSDRVSQLTLSSQRPNSRTRVSFLGPTGQAIRLMGDKLTSKQMAREAGVSIVPGYNESLFSHELEKALYIANHEITYPVMIKALAGGGGKGMRICRNDDELKEGWVLSTAEAKQFFKDERVVLEKYIERPHHIEFQVLAGRRGDEWDIVCFPERECSIQRRNQKIIEESPSCLLHPTTRAEMVRQVKSLIRRVGYTSAGTVEFLVDEDQHFYFLEMNTRLQVEHPVTEMLVSSGEWMPNTHQTLNEVDLVKGMIDVAAGRGVPKEWLQKVEESAPISNIDGSKDIESTVMPFKGHAIEVRF
jgi:propionyl-CoA carboxylase alpha chain